LIIIHISCGNGKLSCGKVSSSKQVLISPYFFHTGLWSRKPLQSLCFFPFSTNYFSIASVSKRFTFYFFKALFLSEKRVERRLEVSI